jgi:uncharacterized membrane protein HdeD (DUF308 family)
VAIVLGLFVLRQPEITGFTIGVLLAIYLLVAGAIQTLRGRAIRQAGQGGVTFYRGIVGLVAGGVVLFMALFRIGGQSLAFTILSIGLIAYGALGLWASVVKGSGCLLTWGSLIVNGLLVVLGVLIFLARFVPWNVFVMIGWILLIAGGVILVWTFLNRGAPAEAESSAP